MSFMQAVILSVLGAVGVCARVLLVQILPIAPISMGVLLSNSVGSFLAGILYSVRPFGMSDTLAGILVAGLLGALTTFSSMAIDSVRLMAEGQLGAGLLNIFLNNLCALALCGAGFYLGKVLST